MDSIGTNTIKNEHGNFRKMVAVHPHVIDWDLVHEYVRENNAFHLMYKQLTAGAYREVLDAGEIVPGVEPYEKETISICIS